MSILSIEQVSESVSKPFWFQLYVMRDRDFVASRNESPLPFPYDSCHLARLWILRGIKASIARRHIKPVSRDF
jgi:hypothetical protein